MSHFLSYIKLLESNVFVHTGPKGTQSTKHISKDIFLLQYFFNGGEKWEFYLN